METRGGVAVGATSYPPRDTRRLQLGGGGHGLGQDHDPFQPLARPGVDRVVGWIEWWGGEVVGW